MPKKIFRAAVFLLIALRILHFGVEIDNPHPWRQYDTANYIQDFYENGIDIFHPAVCWMGGHRTLILECPIPEAIAVLPWYLTGPDHRVARVIFLLFFLGACLYFYRIVKMISGEDLAKLATLIFMIMPLGLAYSRAIHIDFSAVFMAHAMCFHFLKGIKEENRNQIIAGAIWGILAFTVKAPYAFYLALPILYVVIKEKKLRFVLRYALLFVLPVLVFMAWMWHSRKVNGAAPDWYFIPGYRKMDSNWTWYFGTIPQRLEAASWIKLGRRILFEVTTRPGMILFAAGLLLGIKSKEKSFWYLWLLATIGYMCLFFNLNVVHNYYQIPFMAPMAVFMAMAIHWASKRYDQLRSWAGPAVSAFFILLIFASAFRYAESSYYGHAGPPVPAGKLIDAHTPDDALVITSWWGLNWQSPNLLYNAQRDGWTIQERFLKPALIYRLMEEGADYVASIRSRPPEGELERFTRLLPEQKFKVDETLDLYLYELKYEYLNIPDSIKVKGRD